MRLSNLKIMFVVAMLAGSLIAAGQARRAGSKKSTATTKTAAATKAIGAWVNFSGGEDVNKIAADAKNLYVSMNYTKRLVVIDKTTGELSAINADHDISSVAVANGVCYYYVVDEGIFSYNSATGKTEGPLFGLQPSSDDMMMIGLEASSDGRYLFCNGQLVDLTAGRVVSTPGLGCTSAIAVNNLGGVYTSNANALYTPLDGETMEVSSIGTSVACFFPDNEAGVTYYCLDQGFGFTPLAPEVKGVKRLYPSFQTEHNTASFITRDDDGNFIVSTNFEGIGFGGKNIDEPFRMERRIASGVKNDYGSELFYNGGHDYIAPDGQGNIIFGSKGYACILIYNPKGIKGYANLKGKAVKFPK